MYHPTLSSTTKKKIKISSLNEQILSSFLFSSMWEIFPPFFPHSLFHFFFSFFLFPDSFPRQNISRPPLAFPSNHQWLVSSSSLVSLFFVGKHLHETTLFFFNSPQSHLLGLLVQSPSNHSPFQSVLNLQ